MLSKPLLRRRPKSERVKKDRQTKDRKKVFNKFVENKLIERVSYEEYRDKVRDVYDGPQGAFLATASLLSGHIAAGDKLLRERQFDLRGAKQILDVGSGAGQIAKHLLKYSDQDAQLTCFDLSLEMMRRARTRLKSAAPSHLVADLTQLPFADGSFDCVTCGYVLEHLPEARDGLSELSRVMRQGARMLLLTTEDNFSGAWTSRLWCCRTYNRQDILRVCHELGLRCEKELWFSRMHKLFRAGGICVELIKQ